jgi:hypothetical protein
MNDSIKIFQSINSKGYWMTMLFVILHLIIIGLSIIFFERNFIGIVLINIYLFVLFLIDGIIIQVYLNSDFYKELCK